MKDRDLALLEKALSLATLTVEQRRAFSQMRDALEQREHVALSPKQRLWAEQIIERGAGTTGLAAIKTILSNLDRIGIADTAYAKSGGVEKVPGVSVEVQFGAPPSIAQQDHEFDVDSFVDESHHDVASKDDDEIPF